MPGFNFEGTTPNFTIASGDKIENACLVTITATVMYNFIQRCEVRRRNNSQSPVPTAYDLWKTTGFPKIILPGDPRYNPSLDPDGDGHMDVRGKGIDIKTSCIPIGTAPVTSFNYPINGYFPVTSKIKSISNYPSEYKGPGSAWDDEKKKHLGILPKWCKDEDDERVVEIPIEKTLELWWPGCDGCSPKEFEDLLRYGTLGPGIDNFLNGVLFKQVGLDYRGLHDIGFNINDWRFPAIWRFKGHVFPGYDPDTFFG